MINNNNISINPFIATMTTFIKQYPSGRRQAPREIKHIPTWTTKQSLAMDLKIRTKEQTKEHHVINKVSFISTKF